MWGGGSSSLSDLRLIYYGKAGFGHISRIFSLNSQLFASKTREICLKPAFSSLRSLKSDRLLGPLSFTVLQALHMLSRDLFFHIPIINLVFSRPSKSNFKTSYWRAPVSISVGCLRLPWYSFLAIGQHNSSLCAL